MMTSTTGKQFIKKGRIRKQVMNNQTGYFMLVLYGDNGRETVAAHRVVAEAFHPNPDNLPVVNHKNEVRSDNRAENLEWCTTAYNLWYSDVPSKCKKPVVQIDPTTRATRNWESARDAHRETGIEYKNISACCRGLRPRAGGFEWRFLL